MIIDCVQARERMVKEQLLSRGIDDPRVLRAMAKVPRHLFLERDLWDDAYEDHPLPIGANQTISQPYYGSAHGRGARTQGNRKSA